MLIAVWNLNHRTGKMPFFIEAVDAIAALQADVVVLTEYYPKGHHDAFCAKLSATGWPYWIVSDEIDGEIANRVLIASRSPLESAPVTLPTFDRQFPPNILAVKTAGLRFLGVRIPAYEAKDRRCLLASWDWLETTMSSLHDAPTVVIGDLNVSVTSPSARGGEHFRRILADGWRRATPTGGASYFGHNGRRSEIDHILCNGCHSFADARYVVEVGGWRLAGGEGALSDHAALLAEILEKKPDED